MAEAGQTRAGRGPAWRQTCKVVACTAIALGACAAATQSAARRDVLYQEPMGKVYTGFSGAYSYQNDPWLAAGKGSYRLWANDYASRHGDGTKYSFLTGTHGLAKAEEEPDRLNRKNGWEQKEFFKWVRNQGGDAPEGFQEQGSQKMGSEYIHSLKRLGINSFADLMDFNNEYDMPQFPCEQNEDSISAHADCGKLELFTDEAKAQPLWFADNKGHLTDDDIKGKMKDVRAHVKNMLPDLSGNRPWDDPLMYCYAQYPDGPEYAQCMSDIKAATVDGHAQRPPKWKEMTKGLWKRHSDGSLVHGAGDDKLFGANWGQLTKDLWDYGPDGMPKLT